jgi:hypothetical protein
VGAALIAAVSVSNVGLAAVALAAAGVAIWAGRQRDGRPQWLVVSVGVTMNVLARSDLEGFLGASALVGVLVGLVVFVTGLSYRPRVVRRTAWALLAVLVVIASGASAAFGFAALDVRSDLHNGQTAAEIGVDLLHGGDYAAAAEQFEAAATWLGDGSESLRRPLPSAAGLVPVMAQHRHVAADVTAAGADASRRLVTALRQVDGRPDCAVVEAALATLRQAVDDARSPWLVPEVAEELDSMVDHLGPREGSAAC